MRANLAKSASGIDGGPLARLGNLEEATRNAESDAEAWEELRANDSQGTLISADRTLIRKPPMPEITHPDIDVAAAFRKLQDALVTWERATGRSSLLIFRETYGNAGDVTPSLVSIRLSDGIPVDPANSDLRDSYLLKRFADSA